MAAAETYTATAPGGIHGRSIYASDNVLSPSSYDTRSSSRKKLKLVTSPPASFKGKILGNASASPSAPAKYQIPSRTNVRSGDARMGPTAEPTKNEARRAKLHKRGGSGSSLPGSPAPASASQSNFVTPFATYEEPSPVGYETPPTSSTPKIRPYLRKMSTNKEDPDQGGLDLSKSLAENSVLAGLGIQELGPRAASDVSFTQTGRRSHARNTSGESHTSTASGSMRPTKPFVHPMRQTPRPYTPPHGHSYESSMNDEERQESDDVMTDDDFRLGHGFRSRRSVSISSTPVIAPTPLSQSHTASDLGLVPKITGSTSQTNLSITSAKSSKSKSRSRRNTERSLEDTISPSSRTSFDKAFSVVSRKSDTDPLTRDQRIEAARRKFEAQQANKQQKHEGRQLKRRETEEAKRRKSEAEERTRESRSGEKQRLRARSHEEVVPARAVVQKRSTDSGEKGRGRGAARGARGEQAGGWERFTAWFQTRLLSCGEKG